MKKTYRKPEIFFENFSLSTSIAGNCDIAIGLPSQFVCGIPDENGLGMKIFNTNLGGDCSIPGGDDAKHDGFCYHVPTAGMVLFNS